MKQNLQKDHMEVFVMRIILVSFLILICRLLYVNKRLKALAMIDPVTNLPNRRAVKMALAQEQARAERYHRTFTVLFLDVDHFKAINDGSNSHYVGDAVLREFAEVVRSSLRRSDILGRWGGDEFLVILPETEEVGAQQAAERINMMLAKHSFNGKSEFHLTCSIGIATYPFTAQERERLVDAADYAMYTARNRSQRIR